MKAYKYIVAGFFYEASYYEHSEKNYFSFSYDTLEKATLQFHEMKKQFPSQLLLTVKTEEVIMDIRDTE